MNIGRAAESDLPELIEMLCLAYTPSLESRFRAHHYQDSTYELHHSRVGKVDGKVVSYVRISDRPIRIRGCVVNMGGVGAVSTHPDYRGRGYNSLVLDDAIQYMEDQGYDISMLFTGIPDHYAKLGWVPFPEHSITVAPANVPGTTGERTQPPFRLRESAARLGDAYAIRPFDEAMDLDGVIQIYDEHNRERTGTLVRRPEYWRCGHSRLMGILPNLVVEAEGAPVAYINSSTSAQVIKVSEVGYLPDRPDAVWAMARWLIEHGMEVDARQIQFRLGRLHPLPEIVCEISNGRMSHSEHEGMMLRLINFTSLLRKLVPDLQRRLRRSGFRDAKASIALCVGDHCATLHIAGGRAVVEDGTKLRVKLSLGTRSMARMLMGDATLGQMSALSHVHGIKVTPRTAALLDALFPIQNHVYWSCDHF